MNSNEKWKTGSATNNAELRCIGNAQGRTFWMREIVRFAEKTVLLAENVWLPYELCETMRNM